MNKRGAVSSETSHVAIVIVVIALLILVYFVLLPEEDKSKLLGEEGKTGEISIILSETPGHVYPYSSETEEKKIASVNLYSQVKTAAQDLVTRAHVTRNIFTGQTKTIDFVLEDLSRIKSLGLLFNIIKAKGDLIVILNDEEVFRGSIVTGDLPIDLPLSLLKVNNQLEIKVSNPSWKFLSTNSYDLKDVQLIKSYSMENKFENRDFIIYDREKVKKAELEFYVNCMDINVEQGLLGIEINGVSLLTGKVSCVTDRIKLDIDKDNLRNGQNVLTFKIDKGNYVFESIILNLNLEKEYYPEYYFAVDKKEGDYELNMDFSESEVKRAAIMVNGNELTLASEDMDYSKEITDFIVEGENHIKIIAKNEFTITNLEIIQEK